MPLFSDLSNISHYYSGGSSSLNYLAGPYAGHSSIVAANYRTPPPTFSKPSSRLFSRGYKPHLATISENQMTRAGLSRINSPKMLYRSSPKYKIQKPISINTADIDVSSNRYRRNYDRPQVSSPPSTSPRSSTIISTRKSPEASVSSFKEQPTDEDPEGLYMPRIDKNFRTTIKRERTVVRLHTLRDIDKIVENETDESPPKKDKKIETVKIFDEEIKKPIPKWRENFEPDELQPSKRKIEPKPLSEKYVEKFLIKDKDDPDYDSNNAQELEKSEEVENQEESIQKTPSFHDICKTISSDKINEELINPGHQLVRRNTRKLSNCDVMKAIRRNSAEINHEEIKILDDLIRQAHLDSKENNVEIKQNNENEDPQEDVKKKKKFTKKKSNEKLVDDEVKEEKATPLRRKIVKKKTTGSLEKAIEAITPKDSKVSEEPKKVVPKISGTVEIESKPNLKLVVDKIHVEETVLSSASPTTKKFKYNVTIQEVVSPEKDQTEPKYEKPKSVELKSTSKTEPEKKLGSNKIETKTNIEQEKPKIVDVKKPETINKEEPNNSEAITKAELEKQKMLDQLIGKKPEPINNTKLEKSKTLDQLNVKTESNITESINKAELEKQKMLDQLIGKKPEPINKAELEKQKMLDQLLGKKPETSQLETKPEPTKLEVRKLEPKTEEIKKIPETKKEEKQQIIPSKSCVLDSKIEEKNKLNEEQTKLKQSNSSSQSNILSKVGVKSQKPEPEKQKTPTTPTTVPQRKSLQKQENMDENNADNFWDIIGKRETIYYKNRRKYLEERKQEEMRKICWTPEWDQENENSKHPYSISNSEILEKSKASEARLRQKLADMEAAESIELEDEKSPKNKLKQLQTPLKQSTSLDAMKKVEDKPKQITSPTTKTAEVVDKQKQLQPLKQSTSLDTIKTKTPANTEKPKTTDDKPKTIDDKPKQLLNTASKTPTIAEKLIEDKTKQPPNIPTKSTELKTPTTTEKPKTIDEKTKPLKTIEDKSKQLPTLKQSISLVSAPKTTESLEKSNQKLKQSTSLESVDSKTSLDLKQKQKINKYPQKAKQTKIEMKPQSSFKSTTDKPRPPKLSVKQKSEEKIEKKIRPRLQRQSKSLDFPNKEKIKLTPLEIAEMKAIVRDIHLDPLKPELDFIIKEEFDPVLKPNEDLIVPTPSLYKKIKPQLDERDKKKRGEENEPKEEDKKDETKDNVIVPLQSNFLVLPEPKPKPKPKWFDECPVVIMATPRDLRKRNPIHRKRPEPQPVPKVTYVSDSDEETDSSDEENSTSSSSSSSSGGSDEFETNIVFDAKQGNKWKSTSSNDSGFDSSAPGSPANNRNRNDDCDVNCHKKCEKLTANLCGVNQKLIVEALSSVKKGGSSTTSMSSSSESTSLTPATNPAFTLEPMEVSSAYTAYQKSGRVTPPATSIPRFRKYIVDDFVFLKVLGKGSFGKVLLAELRNTEYYYAVKCLKKDIVLEDDDVECTLIERKVLALGTKHPYLCHLFCTFQTESHLFFVMEYLNGGDLMFHIQVSGRFPEPRAKFYGAEIVSGLKFLHSKGIVYRDLKLDNILLDFDGHVRIADFGMCKLQIFLDRTADTFCGTPDYMAPEIIKGQHYNQGVDWWSFGVLLYEMLIGQSPFSGCDEDELFWSICNERPVIPGFLSKEASQILTLLLEKDSSKRLGNKYCIAGDIIDQPFFKTIDWGKLELRQLEAPFKPKVQHPLDTQYFDKAFTAEKVKLTPIEKDILHSMDQTQFHGFSYTNPNATDK